MYEVLLYIVLFLIAVALTVIIGKWAINRYLYEELPESDEIDEHETIGIEVMPSDKKTKYEWWD